MSETGKEPSTGELQAQHLEFIRTLRAQHARELHELKYVVHQQQFDIEAMRWAFRGLVEKRVHVNHSLTPESLTHARDLKAVGEVLGDESAARLLDGANQAFRSFAELNELRAHIHYLEGHARQRGLEFRPFAWPATGTMPPERVFWPCRYFGTDAAP